MSDYLWDKTGEPDAEVERLEKLLGTLAREPRPLELPDAARVEHAPPRRATRPALAAVAAALALMLLAGAWLIASRRASGDRRTAQSSPTPAASNEASERGDVNNATPNDDKNKASARDDEGETARRDDDKHEAVAREPGASDDAVRREFRQRPSHQQSAGASASRRVRRGAVHTNAGLAKKSRGVEAREERPKEGLLAVVMERQQTAKAQLVYALRLTGAKLSEVQTKVRGAGEERPASDGPNKIR